MARYSKEQIQFVKDNAEGLRVDDLKSLFNNKFDTNITYMKMRCILRNHKIRTNAPKGNKPGTSKVFSDEIQKYIVANIEGTLLRELTMKVNETFGTSYSYSQIKGYASNHGLTNGVSCRFTKGHMSLNPIKKGQRLSKATEFKKGNRPVNYRPVGSERVSADGYIEVKVADPKTWKSKHVIVWESANGPIPKGKCVMFGDGNKSNVVLENLILVSRAQLARLNQDKLIQKDAELTRSAILLTDVKTKISKLKKANKERKVKKKDY